jgi:hypothetical protein
MSLLVQNKIENVKWSELPRLTVTREHTYTRRIISDYKIIIWHVNFTDVNRIILLNSTKIIEESDLKFEGFLNFS